jgi:FKBP-type peptidyl-prolyl cis-trans isomerase
MKIKVLIPFLFLVACNETPTVDTDQDNDEVTTENKLEFDTYNEKISYSIGLDHARGCYKAYSSPATADKFNLRQIEAGMVDYLLGEELQVSFLEKDSLLDLYLLPNGEVDEMAVSKNDASYAVGLDEAFNIVSSLVGRKIDQTIEVELLVEGIKDGMQNLTPSIPYMDARREIDKYYSELNLDNGKLFLEENLLFEGVIETESGLQYEVIKEGSGISPNLADSVTIHYTGRFIDGRVFESTVPSNVPFSGPLLSVIAGWQEGVTLMREGGQSRFYIPHNLAYGPEGKGVVEPNSTLIFDIELLAVKRLK